jgi:hypothetical protein
LLLRSCFSREMTGVITFITEKVSFSVNCRLSILPSAPDSIFRLAGRTHHKARESGLLKEPDSRIELIVERAV